MDFQNFYILNSDDKNENNSRIVSELNEFWERKKEREKKWDLIDPKSSICEKNKLNQKKTNRIKSNQIKMDCIFIMLQNPFFFLYILSFHFWFTFSIVVSTTKKKPRERIQFQYINDSVYSAIIKFFFPIHNNENENHRRHHHSNNHYYDYINWIEDWIGTIYWILLFHSFFVPFFFIWIKEFESRGKNMLLLLQNIIQFVIPI